MTCLVCSAMCSKIMSGSNCVPLILLAPHVKPEFIYNVGKQELRTPDWIIDRCPDRLVFVECKARRPAVHLYTRCSPADREKEIKAVIARAIKQFCVFLTNLRAGCVPAVGTTTSQKYILALVLYESFPFHAFPKTRKTIDRLATALAPEWPTLRADVTFVPLSVQSLSSASMSSKRKAYSSRTSLSPTQIIESRLHLLWTREDARGLPCTLATT